jgi:hypothetical protein
MLSTNEYKQLSTSYVPNSVIVKFVARKIHSVTVPNFKPLIIRKTYMSGLLKNKCV